MLHRPGQMSSNASSSTPSTATSTDTATTTMTVTETTTNAKRTDQNETKKPKTMSLKLKGTPKEKERTSRHIHWSEDTIDNEDLNKKKSNLCCIFHPNEPNDHEDCCKNRSENDEIPEGKNVYDYQPKYKKK